MPAGSRIRFGGRGLVGFGRATLGTDIDIMRGVDGGRDVNVRGLGGGRDGDSPGVVRFGRDGRGGTQVSTVRLRPADDFFVFEPQAEVLTRLTDSIGLNWAAGYRLTALTDALDDRDQRPDRESGAATGVVMPPVTPGGLSLPHH